MGPSAHYSKKVKDWLDTIFEDWWMGRGGSIPWPARSPDLTPLDFWIWGYLKNRVYGQQISTLQQLEDAIKDELQAHRVYGQQISTLQQLKDAIKDELQAIPETMVHNATLRVVEVAKELISINGLQLGIFN